MSQTKPHPPISFVAFGVAMLAFAACSGGGGGSSPTPVTQTSAAPGTANTTASPAANATAQGASPAPGASSAPGTATASASPAATASLPTLSLTGVNAKTYTETPFRAQDVSNSFGVNVDLADISSANVAPTASLLKSLGITHVRIGILKSDATYDSTVTSFLSQSGASALGITNCTAPLGPSLNSGVTASDISTFNSAIGGKLEGYEAMNEPDAQASADPLWVQNLVSCMQGQENAISGIPFVGPAISNELGYASDVGNQTSIINYGNFHRYLAGHNPDTPGYGGTYSCGVYGALNWAICEAQIVSGNEPITITEQGYSTTNEVDQTTQAKYLSRAFFVNSNAGIARTYVYTLTSYTGGDAFGGDGILNTDLSTKPAYTAIQSTLGELSDSAEGSTPASVSYAIVGAPSTLEHQLIEKSNGSYVLVLWNETPSWNTTTSVPITVAPTNVTVAFPFPVTSVKATSLSDAGSPTTPNSITLATNGIIVPVDDHLTFITFSRLLQKYESGSLSRGAKTASMLRGPLITIAAIAVAATPALAQPAPTDEAVDAGTKLGMRELNNSGQTGFVTLFSHGANETLVIVNITAPSGTSEFAHIHRGRTQPGQENSCDNLDPRPAYVLHPVVNGRSATLVKAPEDKLLSGNYVINVHAQNDLTRYVSCGELNK